MSAVDLDPFAFAGQSGGDAELVRAERRLRDILPLWEREPLSDEEADALSHRMYEQIEIINNTAPTTLFGAAIKLRVLADPDHGMEAGDREDDWISLRQVRDFIEREVAAGHAVVAVD